MGPLSLQPPDLHRLAGADAFDVSRKYGESRHSSRRIGDHEQGLAIGNIAHVGVSLRDHSANRRKDRISLKRVAAFDPRQQGAAADTVADVPMHGNHRARILGSNFGTARRIELDTTDDFDGIADLLRPDRLGSNAGRAGGLVGDSDPSLVGRERPPMLLARGSGHDDDVEAVWLDEYAAPAQIVFLRAEGEGRLLAVEPRDHHPRVDLAGIERLPVAEGVEPILGGNAVLENRQLDREVAVAEHPAVVRPTLVVSGGHFTGFGFRRFAAGLSAGRQRRGQQGREDEVSLVHRQLPPTRSANWPVSRSSSTFAL